MPSNLCQNKEYFQEERDTFRHDKKALVVHAKDIEDQVNGSCELFFSGSETQKGSQILLRKRMAEFIRDKRLLEGENDTLLGQSVMISVLTRRW